MVDAQYEAMGTGQMAWGVLGRCATSPLEYEEELLKERMDSRMQHARAAMAENIPDFQMNENGDFCRHKPLDTLPIQSTHSSDVSSKLHHDLISDSKSKTTGLHMIHQCSYSLNAYDEIIWS